MEDGGIGGKDRQSRKRREEEKDGDRGQRIAEERQRMVGDKR